MTGRLQRPVRIAVDARPLAPPVTGIGVYTGSLLAELVEGEHQWFLYSDRPLAPFPWLRRDNVSTRHGNCSPRSLTSLLYANWHFARWAQQDGVALYWSPRHHLPVTLPRSIPSVVTVHDLVWRRYPDTLPWRNRQLERLAMGAALQRAREVIAVSEFTAAELGHFYPGVAAKCAVIAEAGRALGQPEVADVGAPYFLFVGTLEPRKNLPALLEAFARFLAQGAYPHRLVLAGGEGWGALSVPDLCADLGIDERVIRPGYVSDAQLAGLYAGAQALVLPSLYEGFGLPVVEAMAHGTPVVVSDRGALAEVAGDAGLLVAPDSPQSICEAMTALASDPALREGLGRAARLRAGAYSWRLAAAQTLTRLEQAAA